MLAEKPWTRNVEGATEKRAFERVQLLVPGQIFDPIGEATSPCHVICLSPGGAGFECSTMFKRNMSLVLYIEGFGRFEGHVIPHDIEDGAKYGLRFALSPARQGKVLEMVSTFLRDGILGVTQSRISKRIRTNGRMQLSWGSEHTAEVELIDIALEGVSLRTPARPPLGQLVLLNQTQGEIVRHHNEGIALRFLRGGEVKPANLMLQDGSHMWGTF